MPSFDVTKNSYKFIVNSSEEKTRRRGIGAKRRSIRVVEP